MTDDWYSKYRRRVERKRIVRLVAASPFWFPSPPYLAGRAYVRWVARQIVGLT